MTNEAIDIAVAQDEVVLRQYQISEVDYRVGFLKDTVKMSRRTRSRYDTTGTVYVTNRRLIYNVDNKSLPLFGLRCKDMYSQQVRIEDIQGVDFMTSASRNKILWPIIMILLGILFFFMFKPLGIILLIVGIIWLIIRIVNVEEHMMFGIRAASQDYSIFVSEMSRGYYGRVRYWCAPTEQFEVMAKELGAIVLDLQKYGDDAIPRWMSPAE